MPVVLTVRVAGSCGRQTLSCSACLLMGPTRMRGVPRVFTSTPGELVCAGFENQALGPELLQGGSLTFPSPECPTPSPGFSGHQQTRAGWTVGRRARTPLWVAMLNVSSFVPTSTGMFPRPVPGAASVPGGSRRELLQRQVPNSRQLPVGAVPVPGR